MPERLLPAFEVIEEFEDLRTSLTTWTPVVLTENGQRVAVIVAWDWWSLQHERYLHAAALYWAHWHTGQFDARGFGWDILRYLRPPMQEPMHPSASPVDGEGPGDEHAG
jgi:hypothetical protein